MSDRNTLGMTDADLTRAGIEKIKEITEELPAVPTREELLAALSGIYNWCGLVLDQIDGKAQRPLTEDELAYGQEVAQRIAKKSTTE